MGIEATRATKAFYVLVRINGLRFLNENPDTGALDFSSCPHTATLYTSESRAARRCAEIRRALKTDKVQVMPTRTNNPLEIKGP